MIQGITPNPETTSRLAGGMASTDRRGLGAYGGASGGVPSNSLVSWTVSGRDSPRQNYGGFNLPVSFDGGNGSNWSNLASHVSPCGFIQKPARSGRTAYPEADIKVFGVPDDFPRSITETQKNFWAFLIPRNVLRRDLSVFGRRIECLGYYIVMLYWCLMLSGFGSISWSHHGIMYRQKMIPLKNLSTGQKA